MHLLEKGAPWLERAFHPATGAGARWIVVPVLAAAALLGLAQAWLGAPVMSGRPWDMLIELDGAWRMWNGLVIHRDFFSHLGALPFAATLAGMRLVGPGVFSFTVGIHLIAWMVLLPGVWILARRTRPAVGLPMGLFFLLLIVSPRPLGDPAHHIDYAMSYNRYSEAMLGLWLLLAGLPERREGGPVARGLDALAGGWLLLLLLFTKMNYFALACALGPWVAFWRGRRAGPVLGSFAVLIALCPLVRLLVGSGVADMLADIRTVAGAFSFGERLKGVVLFGVVAAPLLVPLALLTAELALGARSHRDRWGAVLTALGLAGAGLVLVASNCQRGQWPLFATAAAIALEDLARRCGGETTPARRLFPALAGWAALATYILPIFLTDARTLLISWNRGLHPPAAHPALAGTQLADYRLDLEDPDFAPVLGRHLEVLADQLDLVRREAGGRGVLELGFYNPACFALGLAPPSCGTICFSSIIMSRRAHPSLERLFGKATRLVLGRNARPEAILGPLAPWSLRLVAESAHSRLFEVVGPATPVPSASRARGSARPNPDRPGPAAPRSATRDPAPAGRLSPWRGGFGLPDRAALAICGRRSGQNPRAEPLPSA